MDGGWVRHAIAEAPSKQVSCGRGGQNMGSGRCGGRPYIKISREAPLRAEQDLPATVVRKWDEEQQAAPLLPLCPHSSIRCDDESLQDTI